MEHIQDLLSSKMYPVHSQATSVMILGKSLRKSQRPKFQYLDLDDGQKLEWSEGMGVQWHGEFSMLNTGVSPNVERESSLSQILQENVPEKYFLSEKATIGILRRAAKRGKELPPVLRMTLEQQSNIRRDSFGQEQITHASNLLRELWKSVSQASFEEWIRGTLILVQQEKVLFLEVHGGSELEETEESQVCEFRKGSGKGNNATNGLCQLWKIGGSGNPPQGFKPSEQLAGELSSVMQEMSRQTTPSHTFMLCLWKASNEEGLLRESLQGIFESREAWKEVTSSIGDGVKAASRINCERGGISRTVSSKWAKGTGGPAGDEQYNLICQEEITVDFGRTADRIRINANKSVTLSASGGGAGAKSGLYLLPAYAFSAGNSASARSIGFAEEISPTLKSAGGGNTVPVIAFNGRQDPVSGPITGALGASLPQALHSVQEIRKSDGIQNSREKTMQDMWGNSPCKGSVREALYAGEKSRISTYRVRRLVPTECLRLQGMLDDWLDIEGASDTAKYKAIGNSIAVPCAEFIFNQIMKILRKE